MNSYSRSIELRTFKARGWLALPGHEHVNCLLTEVSETAATLILEKDVALPHEFTLELEGTVAIHRICRLSSQNSTIVNVTFPFRNPHPHKRGAGGY